jgi:hypothetical protein
MRRKIQKFSHQNGGDESAFSADWCKGHFDGHRRRVLDEFDHQWQKVNNTRTAPVSQETIISDYQK